MSDAKNIVTPASVMPGDQQKIPHESARPTVVPKSDPGTVIDRSNYAVSFRDWMDQFEKLWLNWRGRKGSNCARLWRTQRLLLYCMNNDADDRSEYQSLSAPVRQGIVSLETLGSHVVTLAVEALRTDHKDLGYFLLFMASSISSDWSEYPTSRPPAIADLTQMICRKVEVEHGKLSWWAASILGNVGSIDCLAWLEDVLRHGNLSDSPGTNEKRRKDVELAILKIKSRSDLSQAPSTQSGSTVPTFVELQKLILQKLELLEQGQEEIRRKVDQEIAALRNQNQTLIQHVAHLPTSGTTQTKEEVLQGLTPKQEEVLKAIEALQGENADARAKATKLLAELHGNPATKPLIIAIRARLKERNWGVECPKCTSAARLVWQPKAELSNAGCLQFGHSSESGGAVTHGGHTALPKLKIVQRIVKPGGKTRLR